MGAPKPAGRVYAGLAIPANLRLLPTDTDAERLRKRKRVKALKQTFRARKQEEGAEAKAAGWQSFQKNQRTG
jgi:survival-of-motor-neuron-related-splicing factor 30